jgi:hypothetical protein
MAKKTGTQAKEPVRVTLAHLIESLKQIEWEARHVRLALQRLDPATRIEASTEMTDHLAVTMKKVNNSIPPC